MPLTSAMAKQKNAGVSGGKAPVSVLSALNGGGTKGGSLFENRASLLQRTGDLVRAGDFRKDG
jgi:hypothetical protein